MTANIVLWLDLADANQMEDNAIREHVAPGSAIMRLTDHGASRCPAGTPTSWPPVLKAIDRLVREARKLESQSPGCRYWVTGRAGLPAFFHLGHRLSKMAAVTLVHQPQNSAAADELVLDGTRSDADAPPYFERTPSPVPHSGSNAPVALVISSRRRPADQQVLDALAGRGRAAAGVVRAHSPASLGKDTLVSATREIDELVQETCDAHPSRSALAIFIAGPSSLAFIVGRAINPRACRDVQIFQFDGSQYSLAYELPYPPVPDRNRVLFFAASPAGVPRLGIDEEIRAIRNELSTAATTSVEIEDTPAARAIDVIRNLQTRAPGAVHFSGHGATCELVFQDNHGDLRPVATSDLAETFRLAGGSVRFVVLSACHSESHAAALLAHIECVVAMRGPVLDADAIRFSTTFYRRLAEGHSVRHAFDNGLLEMRLDRPSRSRTRDVDAAGAGRTEEREPPQLFERDPGCADQIFLVRARSR